MDAILASLLPTGAVAALLNAQLLYTLPVSLFGMSVAAAELPGLSEEAGQPDAAATLRDRIQRGMAQISYFVVPSAIAFMFLGHVFAAAVFQTGRFHGKPSTMKQSNEKFSAGPSEIGPGREDLIRRGVRAVIRQVIDAALAKIIHYDPLFVPYAKKTMYSLRLLGNESYISPFQVKCMLQGRQPWHAFGASADIRAKKA